MPNQLDRTKLLIFITSFLRRPMDGLLVFLARTQGLTSFASHAAQARAKFAHFSCRARIVLLSLYNINALFICLKQIYLA